MPRWLIVPALAGIAVLPQPSLADSILGQADRPECIAATQKLRFPTYWLGPSFEGLEVSAVLLECEGRGSSITYLYGDCTPQGGGCAEPIHIQNWPPELRNKEMYSEGPPGVVPPGVGPPGPPEPPEPPELQGTDTTVNGVPATDWGGHVDVYHEETTVAIFTEGVPKLDVARALVPAPAVPASLVRHGLFFDPECIDTVAYCEADRSPTSEDIESLIRNLLFFGLTFGVPFLGALLIGRRWTLAIPVIIWAGYFVAGSMGWIPTGESWQFFVLPMMLLAMLVAGLGLVLHAGLSKGRSRS